ncbi:hypothetical protein MtrunA17_Chr4g0026451 [Medicago truncatula]|uniref:Uncharacterized protein n=1 Tax=Medicago truncatula TaxID=3880 RepID=A0A396I4D7_MEDTR|nr:hypothetical protein MtrunA17_Chr4g0026451 [Medicago truncatula]
MKANNLSYINITKRRETICLGENKHTQVTTKTYADTYHIQGRGERGINIIFVPPIGLFRLFDPMTTARVALGG